MFLAIALLFSAATPGSQDLYPQTKSIIQDAERLSLHIEKFEDRSVPAEFAGELYARAGYLEDARLAFSRSSRIPMSLLKAAAVYGDMALADRLLFQLKEPSQRAQAQLGMADAFWRMGQPQNAQNFVHRARKVALEIVDQVQRTRLLKSADQDSQYFAEPPPNSLSPTPHPPARQATIPSPIPKFPITPDGFGDKTGEQREEQSSENAALMGDLYQRIFAHDRDGLQQIQEKTKTPFQKALVIASIEHLMIQAHQPAAAEQSTDAMSEANNECVLAKAEALSAAGAEWLRAGNPDRANALFLRAARLATSAANLPLGQVAVLTSIGEAEAAGGLMATSQDTLKVAQQTASQLPLPPSPPINRKDHTEPAKHYRPEAYRQIFAVALRSHDLGTARGVATLWNAAATRRSFEIISAWIQAGETTEAIAFAATIQGTSERAEAEFVLAGWMLDQAGAPNI